MCPVTRVGKRMATKGEEAVIAFVRQLNTGILRRDYVEFPRNQAVGKCKKYSKLRSTSTE